MVGINSNLIASSATRNLGAANSVVSSAVAKLSSGNRIIKASDDVAGLAIGTSIQSTVRTLEVALLNTQQATSVLSIADGALQQIGDILTRQASLASQANSGSLGATERGFINQEFQALVQEIDRIVGSTQFNGITLLNGSLGSADGRAVVSDTIAYTVGGDIGSTALDGTTFTIGGTANAALIGSLENAVVTGINAGAADGTEVQFTLTIGNSTYVSDAQDVTDFANDAPLTVVFTDSVSGNTITVALATYVDSDDNTEVGAIASAIQADIRTIDIYQSRTFATTAAGVPATNTNGTVLEGLSGASITLSSTAYTSSNTAPVVGAVTVSAEITNVSDGNVTLTIGGNTYTTVENQFGNGANIQGINLGNGNGVIRAYLNGDNTSTDYIDIDLTDANITGIDLDTVGSAASLQTALNSLFGVGNNGALSFQVGSQVSDSISVSIASVRTADIYLDDTGAAQTLDITTQGGAQTAAEVIANAISNVVGRRADVGAAISRFNFAASNLEVSIANQDAARGSFLDADIATESTNFATAQVKLQASIAVLAQANQLPATLLRLLQ